MSAILLLLPRAQVRDKLVDRIELGQAVLNEPIQSEADWGRVRDDYNRWRDFNILLLKRLFSDEEVAGDYAVHSHVPSFAENYIDWAQALHRKIEKELNRLRSLIERLELYDEAPTVPKSPTGAAAPTVGPRGDAVFIVHGHAHREEEVARLLEKLSGQSIILKDELHGGSVTLIEKLEREAKRCGYAVVVYTGDDVGRAATAPADHLAPRARENVVLELGYFIALLGRDRVTILHDPAVKVPSDFAGVGYYPLDELGAWRGKLEGELRRAGMIDSER